MLKSFDSLLEYIKRLSTPTVATALPLILLYHFEIIKSGDIEFLINTAAATFNELLAPLVEILSTLELEMKRWQIFLLLYISYSSLFTFISNYACKVFQYEPYSFSFDQYAAASKERSALVMYAESSQERNHGNMFSGFNNKIYEVINSLRKSGNLSIDKQERRYILWSNLCSHYFFSMIAVFAILLSDILPEHDTSNAYMLIASLLFLMLVFQIINELSKEEYAHILMWVALNELHNKSNRFERDHRSIEQNLEYYSRGESIPGLPYGYFSVVHYIRQIPLFGNIGKFPWKPSDTNISRDKSEITHGNKYNWTPATWLQKSRTKLIFTLVELGWIKIDGPVLGTVHEKDCYIGRG